MEKTEYGYIGPSLLFELGTREYVRSFFVAIEKYVFREKLYRQLDWSLITDRLYKRTIPHEQLDAMISTMAQMLHLLRETPMSAVDWPKLGLNGPEGGPHHRPFDSNGSLGDFYGHFGRGLVKCAINLRFGQLHGEEHAPVRIGSFYHYNYEDQRPLDHYEALGPKDLPFWLRDDIDYPEIERIVIDGGHKI
jgi:hypothetical protein